MLKIEKIHRVNFKDVPTQCRRCLYWQSGDSGENKPDLEKERQKREWLNQVNAQFGNCMKIACSDGNLIGFVQYAPPEFFPLSREYVSGPPSRDAILIACLYVVNKKARRKGFGTILLKDLMSELKSRGFSAVETFARKDVENNPSGPLEFYLKLRFRVIRDKDDFPLVRSEV